MSRTRLERRTLVFLGAEAVSSVGTWATVIAVWGYAAYEFDATAGDLALFGIASQVPALLVAPLAGTVIDRVGPRPVLAAGRLGGALAALCLVLAADFRALAGLMLLVGIADGFARPALSALPPRLAADEQLARLNALVSLSWQLAIVLGPAIGALAIGAFGFRGAFVFDSLTYLLGALVVPMLRERPLAEPVAAVEGDSGARAGAGWRTSLDGWRYVGRHRLLLRTIVAVALCHYLYGTAMLVEPLYVRDELERSPQTFAALQSVFGLCLVAAALAVARAGDRVCTPGWVRLGTIASCAGMAVYLGTSSVVVAFAGVAGWGLVTALIDGPARTVLQRGTPPGLHGRVLAAHSSAENAAQIVGVVAAGPLVGAMGASEAAVVVAASVSVVVLLATRPGREALDVPAARAGSPETLVPEVAGVGAPPAR